jgi:hypothetical protein
MVGVICGYAVRCGSFSLLCAILFSSFLFSFLLVVSPSLLPSLAISPLLHSFALPPFSLSLPHTSFSQSSLLFYQLALLSFPIPFSLSPSLLLLFPPLTVIGGMLIDILEEMVKAAKGRPLIIVNPSLGSVPSIHL